jgi:hypothetical protein
MMKHDGLAGGGSDEVERTKEHLFPAHPSLYLLLQHDLSINTIRFLHTVGAQGARAPI